MNASPVPYTPENEARWSRYIDAIHTQNRSLPWSADLIPVKSFDVWAGNLSCCEDAFREQDGTQSFCDHCGTNLGDMMDRNGDFKAEYSLTPEERQAAKDAICGRCSGTGRVHVGQSHRQNEGRCYKCNGTGKVA